MQIESKWGGEKKETICYHHYPTNHRFSRPEGLHWDIPAEERRGENFFRPILFGISMDKAEMARREGEIDKSEKFAGEEIGKTS